jgi:hypothetical protein
MEIIDEELEGAYLDMARNRYLYFKFTEIIEEGAGGSLSRPGTQQVPVL